jgi:hypothetical protein
MWTQTSADEKKKVANGAKRAATDHYIINGIISA